MDDHEDLRHRIDALCAEADRTGDERALAAEMNGLLSEGYARALLAEQALAGLEPEERQAATRAVLRLRASLSDMHERFVAITAT